MKRSKTNRHQPPRPRVEPLEDRCLLSAAPSLYYSIDGLGNNLRHTGWGAVGQDLLRIAPAQYADGVSAMNSTNRPSARLVSTTVATDPTDGGIPNSRFMSDWVYAWGQFIDHDMDLTNDGTGSQLQAANVPVPAGDAYFDPTGTGTQVIYFNRSEYDPKTGTSPANPRQQPNDITAWLDGTQIYGNDPTRAAALRTFVHGMLKTSAGDLMPFNTAGLPNANQGPTPDNQLFLAGDVRANENIELTAVQTLFVREHNYIANQIYTANPTLTDEQIYQMARSIVIAEEQAITFNEFLPALLGSRAVAPYQGYDPRVNPGISDEFSTAAYRFGHSLLAPDVQFLNNDATTKFPQMSLAQSFFNPGAVVQNGIDPILKYLATDNAQEVDTKLVPELQNFLFGPPGAGGFDLASLNIQRGRDHGLADYNTTRAVYGLARVKSFADITSDPVLKAKLQQLYGNVNNVDLWVGGLAEDHVRGGSVGPLFTRIIANQFERVRTGDRLWFEHTFSGTLLNTIEHTTLADIIRRNTGDTNVQDNVFFYKPIIKGQVFADFGRLDLAVAGWTVQLLDSSNNVIAVTVTGPRGMYQFQGLAPGTYHVREVAWTGWYQTSPNPADISITRSMTVSGVNFYNMPPWMKGSGGSSISPDVLGALFTLGLDNGPFGSQSGKHR
jgi:hypothetical protein